MILNSPFWNEMIKTIRCFTPLYTSQNANSTTYIGTIDRFHAYLIMKISLVFQILVSNQISHLMIITLKRPSNNLSTSSSQSMRYYCIQKISSSLPAIAYDRMEFNYISLIHDLSLSAESPYS